MLFVSEYTDKQHLGICKRTNHTITKEEEDRHYFWTEQGDPDDEKAFKEYQKFLNHKDQLAGEKWLKYRNIKIT